MSGEDHFWVKPTAPVGQPPCRTPHYFEPRGEKMPKKAVIIVRLLPEASKVANESLKAEITKELSKAIFNIPWASEVESVRIED